MFKILNLYIKKYKKSQFPVAGAGSGGYVMSLWLARKKQKCKIADTLFEILKNVYNSQFYHGIYHFSQENSD